LRGVAMRLESMWVSPPSMVTSSDARTCDIDDFLVENEGAVGVVGRGRKGLAEEGEGGGGKGEGGEKGGSCGSPERSSD
jgi:hypothetical protein